MKHQMYQKIGSYLPSYGVGETIAVDEIMSSLQVDRREIIRQNLRKLVREGYLTYAPTMKGKKGQRAFVYIEMEVKL
ncbi:MAG: hypothetical protein M1393_04755 [Candidatus Thermoplasmatota archaeon]|nr:hypothetical protein [Candidatus Thermoplasmatota archaeon]